MKANIFHTYIKRPIVYSLILFLAFSEFKCTLPPYSGCSVCYEIYNETNNYKKKWVDKNREHQPDLFYSNTNM